MKARISSGKASPLSVEWVEPERAFNFALYSRHATAVTLLCDNLKDPAKAVFQHKIEYPAQKTGRIWHRRDVDGGCRAKRPGAPFGILFWFPDINAGITNR